MTNVKDLISCQLLAIALSITKLSVLYPNLKDLVNIIKHIYPVPPPEIQESINLFLENHEPCNLMAHLERYFVHSRTWEGFCLWIENVYPVYRRVSLITSGHHCYGVPRLHEGKFNLTIDGEEMRHRTVTLEALVSNQSTRGWRDTKSPHMVGKVHPLWRRIQRKSQTTILPFPSRRG